MKEKNKKAFTLIELLVVVIIIGILAAIALPQYEKAVIRARLATIRPTITAIKNAEEAYYMANGQYTTDASLLDIGPSCQTTEDSSLFICNDFFVFDIISATISLSTSRIGVYYCPKKIENWGACTSQDREFALYTYLDHSSNPGKISCEAFTDKGTDLCKMLQ